jgi:hypothetical protein
VRRRPNPWIWVPSLTMGVLAAGITWWVTDTTCRYNSGVGAGCPGWTLLFTVGSFIGVTFGVGLLLVLVYRSLAEWNASR